MPLPDRDRPASGARFMWALLALSLGALPSCKPRESGPPAEPAAPRASTPSAAPAPPAPPSAGSASAASASSARRPGGGRVPFAYPTVPTPAQAGDVALAPPRQWIDNALERGLETQPFVYFRTRVVEPGAESTLIETPSGRLEEIPNALLIAIRRGQSAVPGQLVLTAWGQGTGLQRAMVVEGGTAKSPRVHYLDLKYDHPSELGKGAEVLEPDTFQKLSEPGEVGTTAACRDGADTRHYVVVHGVADKVLGLGFSGRLRVLARADCRFLPLDPKVEGNVYVPVLGVFRRARVRHLEEDLGRAFVRYDEGGKEQEAVVGVLDVALAL